MDKWLLSTKSKHLNLKKFDDRHVRNFKIASVTLPMITDRHHRHLNAILAKVEDGKRDQGNRSKQAEHLPGNQLVTINGVYGGKR